MAYLALYRQHRPRTLAEIVDQGHVVRTLSNAIMNNKLVHAYLFTGPRGTGKTSVARVLARSLNCDHGPTLSPCGVCPSCKAIEVGSSLDVREIDAASNRGIDDIRDLRQSVHYVAESRYKVYIIDEVHMLSTEAFNALLKTLEEPPEHVIFILATTEVHKIPLTILSRCQRFDFRRISKAPMLELLRKIMEQSGTSISEEALELLVERAQGGLRDALSLLDQCLTFAEAEIEVDDLLAVLGSVDRQTLFILFRAVYGIQTAEMLAVLDEIEDSGRDLTQLLYDMMLLMRQVVSKPAEYAEALGLSGEQAVRALELLARCEVEMKQMSSSRLALELALFRIAEEVAYGGRIEALEARLTALEQGQGVAVVGQTAAIQRGSSGGSGVLATPSGTGTAREKSAATRAGKAVSPAATSGDTVAVHAQTPPQVTTQAAERKTDAAGTGELSSAKSVEVVPEGLNPASVTSDVSGNGAILDIVKSHWEQILERIQKERISVHAILQHGRLLSFNDGQLELVFVQDFHRKILERPENKALLERTISSVSGQACRLKVLLTKELIGRNGGKAPSRTAHLQDVPAVSSEKETEKVTAKTPEVVSPEQEDLLVSAAIALVGIDKVKIVGS